MSPTLMKVFQSRCCQEKSMYPPACKWTAPLFQLWFLKFLDKSVTFYMNKNFRTVDFVMTLKKNYLVWVAIDESKWRVGLGNLNAGVYRENSRKFRGHRYEQVLKTPFPAVLRPESQILVFIQSCWLWRQKTYSSHKPHDVCKLLRQASI